MRTPISADPAEFLGLRFDPLSIDQVLGYLRARAADARFEYIATPNVDHVVRLVAEQEAAGERGDAADAYARAELCVCDSRILSRLARLRGVRLPVVTGSDLTARLFAEVIRPGDRIALVGGDAGMTPELIERFPGLDVRQHLPPMGMRQNPAAMDAAADFVIETAARFTFIAVGSPQQELLAATVQGRGGGQGYGLCIGAAVEFLIDRQKRAPRLLQRLGLEWSHRLLSNPGRLWRRYLVEGPRIFALTLAWRPPRR